MAYIVLDDALAILFGKDVDYSTSLVTGDGGEEDRNANWTAALERRHQVDHRRVPPQRRPPFRLTFAANSRWSGRSRGRTA